MIRPEDIVAYARTWKGARWRHEGRGAGPDRAIDCVGLLVRVADHFGMPYEDVTGYRRNASPRFLGYIERFTEEAPSGAVHGAIGVFSDELMPRHVGILAFDGDVPTVIHAEAWPRRRCIEEPLYDGTPSISERLVDVRLFTKVTYE